MKSIFRWRSSNPPRSLSGHETLFCPSQSALPLSPWFQPTLTCMARMLRGMSSRCCRMLKCHVFIRIMSSNMNSRYKRPSTHTWRQGSHSSAPSPIHGSIPVLDLLTTPLPHTLLPPAPKPGCTTGMDHPVT